LPKPWLSQQPHEKSSLQNQITQVGSMMTTSVNVHCAMCKDCQLITHCWLHDAKIVRQGQKDMGLFLQDIKSHISHNGHKIISDKIIKGHPLPTMSEQRNWISIGSKSWLQMQCDTPRIKRMDRPNLVCNAMEKIYEVM
jgi:hypothetical protein